MPLSVTQMSTPESLAQPDNAQPWYRQPWVWFVFGIPAVSVVVGIALVVIAVRNADSVVRDDWYKDGRAIQQKMARDETAARRQIQAKLTLDASSGEIHGWLSGQTAPIDVQVTLVLSHPTLADQDQTVVLRRQADGRYLGDLDQAPHGRFYVELGSTDWRLTGVREFPLTQLDLESDLAE